MILLVLVLSLGWFWDTFFPSQDLAACLLRLDVITSHGVMSSICVCAWGAVFIELRAYPSLDF